MERTRKDANERLKDRFGDLFWTGIMIAVVAHFLAFAFWPEITTADVSYSSTELTAVDLPEEIEIPPAPEPVARPATPVISARADIPEDITIAPTTFDDNPTTELPPLEAFVEAEDVLSDYQAFTPSMVRPEVRNLNEVARHMRILYPAALREAGVGGRTTLHMWLDENGEVQRAIVGRSSGYPQLDEASLRVIEVVDFSPAMNRDRTVRVLIAWPITWTPVERS